MGEGWSDWFWLMMQIKPGDTRNDAKGIGTFAQNDVPSGQGIRQYKYSTNMAVNPHTYGNTNTQFFGTSISPHGVGSIWAVVLWDLAWNYIDKYGYDPNLYTGTGGNNKVMKLVLDAIKIGGCNPTMVSGRNAILQADQVATGGQNSCLIWSTFARRGLGANASSGNNTNTVNDIKDQIEDFTVPTSLNCPLSSVLFDEQDIKIYPNPSNGFIKLQLSNIAENINIEVYDINGRMVYEENNAAVNVQKTINLNKLMSGVYVLKIKNKELDITRKIIID